MTPDKCRAATMRVNTSRVKQQQQQQQQQQGGRRMGYNQRSLKCFS
jgi:hypothetical protein